MELMREFLRDRNLADLDSIIDFVLSRQPEPEETWVFGYGSLIWNPEMEFDEGQPADLPGFKREMCISSTVHRGTPEKPGLVLGVRHDDGGSCHGYAFKLTAEALLPSLRRLMARELVTDCYLPLWLPVVLADGRETPALTMVVNEQHSRFVQPSFDEKLSLIQTAVGPRGSNLEYLLNTGAHLQECGIADPEIDALYQRLNR